mmetsp:Transcript_70456/g.138362  ORF Transcript_70456/g.138362 Transcript_70456/m.138362 type:complete len:387 (-) Transcript_70456:419-1579(-)|eukprot:CAMPEP_0170378168 /NCGR_PEP_ID=MMETSP0117_2-20130122/12668_1 /TAXON_ID=400756 /ORGANISM="Durinskia baltica, Strain CSIRO CS-38" /LENGTH=386 /DNA_ID=CAMNT_0010633527 /DNA_START=69 /DNA_END=1229 /DNA_ORIENTATION=-
MSTSCDLADGYEKRVVGEVSAWVESLAAKGVKSFKLTECKDRFMKEPMSALSTACERMVEFNKISVDPSSRRIAAYLISETLAAESKEKVSAEKATATRPPPTTATDKPRKQEEPTVLQLKKKSGAPLSAPVSKKQKLDKAVLGTKKISSFFQQQQPKVSQVQQAQQVQQVPQVVQPVSEIREEKERDEMEGKEEPDDEEEENIAPPVKSTSSTNLSSMQMQNNIAPCGSSSSSSSSSSSRGNAAIPRKITASTQSRPQQPVMRSINIVDLMAHPEDVCIKLGGSITGSSSSSIGPCPSAGDGSGNLVLSQEVIDLVNRLVLEGFTQGSGTVAIENILRRFTEERSIAQSSSVGGCADDEAEVQAALTALEGKNSIMVDDGVIYEV